MMVFLAHRIPPDLSLIPSLPHVFSNYAESRNCAAEEQLAGKAKGD
jgi:hypothetical protein